tara:strand:+ start:1690 stop:2898 length:1209 start_codon:yes stop_codon:yes gene_type:complete
MSKGSLRFKNAVLFVGILLIGLNLRPSISAMSALAERMSEDGLSRESIGTMTTIPLILFGVVGLWAGWFGRLMGFARALGLGLLLIGLGSLLRSVPGGADLIWRISGSVLIGAGIALGNVLLPSLVKSRFPNHVGLMTSFYATAMNLGAALGIAVAVPMATSFSGGWRVSLALIGVFAFFAFMIWIPQMLSSSAVRKKEHPLAGVLVLARKKRAWQVAIFMGLQSIIFYSTVAWLPTLLQSQGMQEIEAAGWVVTMQLIGCGASLFIPTLAGKSKSQSGWVVICSSMTVLGLTGILMYGGMLQIISIIVLGLGLNAGFGMVLLVIALRSDTAETAASLSSLAQASGYLLSSPGPWLIGLISTTAGGWSLAFSVIIFCAILATYVGYLSGREGELSATGSSTN